MIELLHDGAQAPPLEDTIVVQSRKPEAEVRKFDSPVYGLTVTL